MPDEINLQDGNDQQQQQQIDTGNVDTGNTGGDQQQQQTPQFPTGKGKTWDDALDAFMHTSDGKPPASGTQQPGSQQQAPASGQQPPKQGAQQQDNTQQQRQGAPSGTAPRQAGATPREFGTLFRANEVGDIYDARGQLIAKQGYGRSIFHKLLPYVTHYQAEADGFRTKLETYESANRAAKDAGLTLDDQSAALSLMVQWKKDPIKAISTLLTIAEQNGRDVSSIRQGGGGASTADINGVVKSVVTEALAPFLPLVQERQRSAEEQQLRDEVATEYNAFVQQYPDAQMHEEAIARVMRDHQLGHREAYFAVRSWAAENGLKWNQPLAQQLQARAGNGGNNAPSGTGNNRPLPNMNGRMNNGGGGNNNVVDANSKTQFGAEDSWDKIGRAIFRQHGIEV